MPTLAAITLANGEATPVNHTFTPLGRDRETGTFWFEDSSPRVTSTSPLGWPRIGVSIKRVGPAVAGQKASDRINRVTISIQVPQMETLGTSDTGLTPSPTVAYVDRAKIEYMLPERDSLADRKDLLAFSKNVLANANIVDIVNNLSSYYG